MTPPPTLAVARVPRRFRRFKEHFMEGHRVALLRDGEQAFPAMLEAIAQAERQVLLEMYWFSSDRIGLRFAAALREAAARGVEVAVLYDSLGSLETDRAMFDDLKEAGAHVVEFNPLMPWRRRFKLAQLSRRDHRKALVVDGRLGFTGGLNISDEWLPVEEGGEGWRDDVVRFEGPAVGGLVACFETSWRAQGGPPLRRVIAAGPPQSGHQAVRIIGEAAHWKRREIIKAYVSNIYRAETRIWITNSYFVPNATVLRSLRRAARRGVDVRVMVPEVSDVPFVELASRALWGRLLRAGVRLFQCGGTVLHAKSAVIDGKWATTGTFNLDYRSMFWNLEVNLAVRDDAFAREMEASFERDLGRSQEVVYETFRRRPARQRWLEHCCLLFQRFL